MNADNNKLLFDTPLEDEHPDFKDERERIVEAAKGIAKREADLPKKAAIVSDMHADLAQRQKSLRQLEHQQKAAKIEALQKRISDRKAKVCTLKKDREEVESEKDRKKELARKLEEALPVARAELAQAQKVENQKAVVSEKKKQLLEAQAKYDRMPQKVDALADIGQLSGKVVQGQEKLVEEMQTLAPMQQLLDDKKSNLYKRYQHALADYNEAVRLLKPAEDDYLAFLYSKTRDMSRLSNLKANWRTLKDACNSKHEIYQIWDQKLREMKII